MTWLRWNPTNLRTWNELIKYDNPTINSQFLNEFWLADEGYCNGLSESSSQQGAPRDNHPLWFAGTAFWNQEVLISSSTQGSPGSWNHCCSVLWGQAHMLAWASLWASLYLLISINKDKAFRFYSKSQIKSGDSDFCIILLNLRLITIESLCKRAIHKRRVPVLDVVISPPGDSFTI